MFRYCSSKNVVIAPVPAPVPCRCDRVSSYLTGVLCNKPSSRDLVVSTGINCVFGLQSVGYEQCGPDQLDHQFVVSMTRVHHMLTLPKTNITLKLRPLLKGESETLRESTPPIAAPCMILVYL